ncbi:MAG: K(+)-stimulated pyrophosphate-energized sodium pump [Paracoccaceae bacterium]
MICVFFIYLLVKRYPAGDAKVQKIGDAIHLGAMVFMHREYRTLAIFSAVLIIILYFTPGLDLKTALAFTVGALSSALTVYIGMYTALRRMSERLRRHTRRARQRRFRSPSSVDR